MNRSNYGQVINVCPRCHSEKIQPHMKPNGEYYWSCSECPTKECIFRRPARWKQALYSDGGGLVEEGKL